MKLDVFYETVAGSRLYGTARESSDYDYRGVGWAPLPTLIGIEAPVERPDQSGEGDREVHELRRFLNLAFANNPNILDVMFAPEAFWIVHSPAWRMIYDLRRTVLSQRIRTTYIGYATSKLQRVQKSGSDSAFDYDLKDAAHLVRLMRQATTILTEGDFSPVLEGEDLAMVREVLDGKWSYRQLTAYAAEEKLKINTLPSALPERPDRTALNQLVMSLNAQRVMEWAAQQKY